jgi:hypothetical protein
MRERVVLLAISSKSLYKEPERLPAQHCQWHWRLRTGCGTRTVLGGTWDWEAVGGGSLYFVSPRSPEIRRVKRHRRRHAGSKDSNSTYVNTGNGTGSDGT